MFFFSRNKFNAKAEKLRLIDKIEILQSRLAPHGMPKVTVALDKITDLLDDKYLPMRKEEAAQLNSFLSDMDAHACKQYEALLLKKCEHITAVVRIGRDLDEQELQTFKNEDRLFEMLGELDLINEQIQSVDKKMDAALGKDKNLWNMLHAQRHTLTSRMMVINKNYQTLLESQNALAVASEVRKAREEADAILAQSAMQDMAEFEENAEVTMMAAEDVRENTAKMQEVFGRTFGGVADSYDYERALEQKLLAEEASAVQKHSAPVVDKQV